MREKSRQHLDKEKREISRLESLDYPSYEDQATF